MAAFPRRAYEGAAAPTTIVSGIDTAATTVTLADDTGWPTGFPFFVMLDQEILASQEKCIATRSGVTLTISRGEDGTTPKSHDAGASIKPIFSAIEADEANQMAALITTRGDLIRGAATGTPQRVALGAAATIMTSDGTDAVWSAPAAQTPADGSITDVKHAPRTINIKTAHYTLGLGDETEVFQFNAASLNVTVPPAATAAFAAGTQIEVENINSTALTVVAGAGVTINNAGGLTLAQYQSGVLRLTATANTWLFFQRGGIGYGTATGGDSSATISVSGVSHTLLTFLNSANLTVTKAGLFDLLLVGGGGGGADSVTFGGGGGAGQVVQGTYHLAVGTYAFVIGTGGAAKTFGLGTSLSVVQLCAVGGSHGGNETAGSLSAKGPSGGGANASGGTTVGIGAFAPGISGYKGGDTTGATSSSGGGGFGAVGANGSGTTGGAGGIGFDASVFRGESPTTTYYAGGGGGAASVTQGAGGLGGGGAGTATNGVAGTANTGGGGGGAGSGTGGAGGKGIALVRFKV